MTPLYPLDISFPNFNESSQVISILNGCSVLTFQFSVACPGSSVGLQKRGCKSQESVSSYSQETSGDWKTCFKNLLHFNSAKWSFKPGGG